jgi:hypothetical protein
MYRPGIEPPTSRIQVKVFLSDTRKVKGQTLYRKKEERARSSGKN